MLKSSIDDMLIQEAFKVLDEHISNDQKIAVAFSGGKDSTCLALLLLDWISERGRSDIDVILVHSDTLSEIPDMENWVSEFIETYKSHAKKLGVNIESIIKTPKPNETFYWRSLIRGYSAPTFSFRWCVYLLKRVPAREALIQVGNVKILLGHRDEESSARVTSLIRRGAICPLTAGKCGNYYYNIEGSSIKIYPIRSWSTGDVWKYLREWYSKINLENLFRLYLEGSLPARYGCWHCTLVKRQLAHYILREEYLYYEAARFIYRMISDIMWLRMPKDKGYSKLGPLTPVARAILARTLQLTEELSRIKFYGLDDAKIEGYTLREILFELSPSKANKIIQRIDHKVLKTEPWRYTSIENVRNIQKHREYVFKIAKYLHSRRAYIDQDVNDRLIEIYEQIIARR